MIAAIVAAFWLVEPEIDRLAGFSDYSIGTLKEYRMARIKYYYNKIKSKLKL